MLALLALLVLLQRPIGTDNTELTGIVDPFPTPSEPSTPAFCFRATAAEAALLPKGTARGRIWICTLFCHLPSEERKALFIERRGHEPVVFVDMDRDGRFATHEAHEFSRRGDLLLRIPVSQGTLREYPILLRHRWEFFKPRGYPERRWILQTATAHFAGRITIDGRSLRVEYPLSWDLGAPVVNMGWIRIDANGDGRIDDDYLSVENVPSRSDVTVLRVGNRYISTVSIDPTTRIVTLREHPASDYRRIEIREGATLPDFSYVDLAGTRRRLSDMRSPLVLVVVWAPWCTPAFAQLLHIERAYRKLGAKGLSVVGLPDETDPDKVRPILAGLRLTWSNADPESVRGLLREQWQIASVPTLIVVDRERRIVKVTRRGDMSLYATKLRGTLEKLLKRAR